MPESSVIPDPRLLRFLDWPNADRPIVNAPVEVFFFGLLDFFYNSDGTCGVGFHSGDGRHVPEIIVIEDNGNDESVILQEPLPNNASIRLGVVNNMGVELDSDVTFLKDGSDEDFRWMIDMRALGWYLGVDSNEVGPYSARLFVRQGKFFTYWRTKFKLVQSLKVEPEAQNDFLRLQRLDTCANVIEDAIFMNPNDRIRLKINNVVTEWQPDQRRYKFIFANLCYDDINQRNKCHFDWESREEAIRNDFHHHRQTLRVGGLPQLSVALQAGELGPGDHDDGGPFIGALMVSTNEAPCMAAGYSGGNGPA